MHAIHLDMYGVLALRAVVLEAPRLLYINDLYKAPLHVWRTPL